MNAFWLNPDWADGNNLRDGGSPFWMRPAIRTSETYCYRHGNWRDRDRHCPSCDMERHWK